MKAESRQIPQKLAARLKFVYCSRCISFWFSNKFMITSFGNCSSKPFSKLCILVETNSFRKQKVLTNPANQIEEGSTKVLFFHSQTFQQSSLSNFEVKEGDYFYLLCFHSMKYSLLPFNKWQKCIVLNAVNLRERETWNKKRPRTTVKCFRASVLFAERKRQSL